MCKHSSKIKTLEPFEEVYKATPSKDAFLFCISCIYKKSSKPVMNYKDLNLQKIEENYIKSYLKKVGKKLLSLKLIIAISYKIQFGKGIRTLRP